MNDKNTDQMPADGQVEIPDFLRYHKDIAALLEQQEDGLWHWFSSDNMVEQAFDDHRLYLLKNSVRLDQENYGELYAQAQIVADRLGIPAKITLFQGQGDSRNAGLVFIPNEVNIIFQGDLLELLSHDELNSVLAHEMAHYLHQTREEGRFFTADRLLDWICGEPGAHQAHATSIWLSRLYQEVFADRVGLFMCGDRDTAISSLIKVGTGLTKVSVEAYLNQAREALELTGGDGAGGVTHPETYIRAIALRDWADDPETADEKLATLVEGAAKLERLDLLKQQEISDLTRALIGEFLSEDWGDSALLEAHARTFFPDYARPEAPLQAAPRDENPLLKIADMHESLKEYFAYVLTDFAVIEPELDDTPLMAAFATSETWGFAEAFDKIVKNDLKMKAKKVAELRAAQAELFAGTGAS